jgi:hypothetical protein
LPWKYFWYTVRIFNEYIFWSDLTIWLTSREIVLEIKLKTRLKETIHKAFSHRNCGSKFVVLGYNSTYFSNKIQKGKTCYSEEQVISIRNSANLELLIDKTSSVYLYVKLNALASWIFLSFTSFWRNSDSYNLKSRSFSQVSSIKTFDFSTLYTTLQHDKLKTRLKETIDKAFSHRNCGSKFVMNLLIFYKLLKKLRLISVYK